MGEQSPRSGEGRVVSGLTISYGEIAIRLVVTVVLCGAIGLERETRDQSAGFRTHILLGLGAALFTLVSAYGFTPFTEAALQSNGRGIQFDPTRIAAQIVTGVGFLGAGAIIRQGLNVRGLTTAASLWATAAIGMAVGAGYFFGAAATTVVVVVSLYGLRELRNRVLSRFSVNFGVLSVELSAPGAEIREVMGLLERRSVEVRSLSAELEGNRARYTVQVRIPPGGEVQDTLEEISALPTVERVSITGLHEAD